MESFFSSWDDIREHREVVLFACGLMSDPTPLVDHVYQKWIDNYLEEIRCDEYNEQDVYKHDNDTDLLKALYAESKVQLPGSPLHNNNINYHDHTENRRDKTHVYTPSKLYVFLNMRKNLLYQLKNREQEAAIPECTLVIRSPDPALSDGLLLACQQIIKNQTIVDLHMFGVCCKHPSESDIINLSENAQSLLLQNCTLPSQLLNHLIRKTI